jgi:hypothetical protein
MSQKTFRRLVLILVFTGNFLFADAQDCKSLISSFHPLPDDRDQNQCIYLTMVTLDNRDIASFADSRLYYLPEIRTKRNTIIKPKRFETLPAFYFGIDNPKFDFGQKVQVFSNRSIGLLPGMPAGLFYRGNQNFDGLNADDLGFQISETNPVKVIITLRSWNNAKVVFTPRCEEGGFMFGSTADVKYILRLVAWPPPSSIEHIYR